MNPLGNVFLLNMTEGGSFEPSPRQANVTVKESFSWPVVTIETVVFDSMLNVSGVWSAFPIHERSYWCFRCYPIMYDWNFWSLCSKFSGSVWTMDIRLRIERLFCFMRWWYQYIEALKSDSLIFFSFASDLAFKRISETEIPALCFSSIHCINFFNSGSFGGHSWAAIWSHHRSFKPPGISSIFAHSLLVNLILASSSTISLL